MSIYVCMYVYTHTHIHTQTYIHIHTYIHISCYKRGTCEPVLNRILIGLKADLGIYRIIVKIFSFSSSESVNEVCLGVKL